MIVLYETRTCVLITSINEINETIEILLTEIKRISIDEFAD